HTLAGRHALTCVVTLGAAGALAIGPDVADRFAALAVEAVDTTGLAPLGAKWLETNPYSGEQLAVEIGDGAYNQNCARCHGLEAKSGGIAPDLRALEPGSDGDEWFLYRVREGATRNGIPYMPRFEDTLSQEAMWAIRAYLETVYDPDI
ncbi:MAG: cytochrome c-550 PedF, partial [Parahaliea sp.]